MAPKKKTPKATAPPPQETRPIDKRGEEWQAECHVPVAREIEQSDTDKHTITNWMEGRHERPKSGYRGETMSNKCT